MSPRIPRRGRRDRAAAESRPQGRPDLEPAAATTKSDGPLRQPGGNWSPDHPAVLAALGRSAIQRMDLLPSGSNYVFVLRLKDDEHGDGIGIYKPRRGEAPLWDFPDGTLYQRERAAYLLSEALDWGLVPPTVIREGEHGVGAVQLFIEHSPRATYFTLKGLRDAELRRMAAFDVIANNADRKGGHCLDGHDGRVWGIDHGLTFHNQMKLRTVIWDYAGEPIAPPLLADLGCLLRDLDGSIGPAAELRDLLHPKEIHALRDRIEQVLETGRYPQPPPWRPVPWPPV